MIELRSERSKTALDVSKALAISQLSEGHAQKLLPTGETVLPMTLVLLSNKTTKLVGIDLIHKLGEDRLTKVHASTSPK